MHLDDIKQFINYLNFNIDTLFVTFIVIIFISYEFGLYLYNNNKKDNIHVEMNNSSDDESDVNECSEDSEDKYTSILFKSFMIMTKKQLLKITGDKYRNSNKDELIIIAMTKFIVNSIENYNYMPIDSKNFVKKNKEIMKEEFYELYKIHKMNKKLDKEEKEKDKEEEQELYEQEEEEELEDLDESINI